MGTSLPLSELALREQYAASGLSALGFTFEKAQGIQSIRIALECGARAAELASLRNKAAPHWTEKYFHERTHGTQAPSFAAEL